MTRTDELRALDQLAERLHSRFPDASTASVKHMAAEVHHEYDGSRVRDFIPVLVEREVVDRYRGKAMPSHQR